MFGPRGAGVGGQQHLKSASCVAISGGRFTGLTRRSQLLGLPCALRAALAFSRRIAEDGNSYGTGTSDVTVPVADRRSKRVATFLHDMQRSGPIG